MSSLSSLPGEMPFCKHKLKENMLCHLCQVCLVKCHFAKKLKENMLCQVCLVKCRFAKNKLKENMLCQTLSSLPGEMPFCKKKLKENVLCHFCQVCLVKCRCANTSRKRTFFVKYPWGNAVFQKQAEREHALSSLSSMPGEVPFCKNKPKENMLCQVCLVKNRKRRCFVKYPW